MLTLKRKHTLADMIAQRDLQAPPADLALRDAARPAVPSVSACQPGCAHCCHFGVLITDVEAAILVRASERAAATPSAGESWRVADLLAMVQTDSEATRRTMDT